MIPHILVVRDEKLQNDFIDAFIRKHQFSYRRIFKIYPAGKEFSIDQIRAIRKELVVSAGGKRLFILFGFGKASFEAQNAFLKTLEEKTDGNDFILIGDNEKQFLPTIRSRGKIVHLKGAVKNIPFDKNLIKAIGEILKARDYAFLSTTFLAGKGRDEVVSFLDEMIVYFRTYLHDGDRRAIPVIKKILQTRAFLVDDNINPQLAVDNLLIFIHKTYSMKKDE